MQRIVKEYHDASWMATNPAGDPAASHRAAVLRNALVRCTPIGCKAMPGSYRYYGTSGAIRLWAAAQHEEYNLSMLQMRTARLYHKHGEERAYMIKSAREHLRLSIYYRERMQALNAGFTQLVNSETDVESWHS